MIYAKLFNVPKIYIGNDQIKFSLKKAEALFYYLIAKKECTKEEIITLLWEDKNYNDAKRNLRNTLYELRKTFGINDIIISKGSSLYLNLKIEIFIDIDEFIKESEDNIIYYSDEFLKGFYIKEAWDFQNWLDEERRKYKELYINKLYKRIENNLNKNMFTLVEQDCKSIIACDKFDEKAYRLLMDTYIKTGSYNKPIILYNQLVDILNQELGITPDPETKALFDKIILNSSNKNKRNLEENKKLFFGRKNELLYLKDNLSIYLKGHSVDPVVIYGEAGVGKSRLCDEFLNYVQADQVCILKTSCYQEDEAFYLKPWYTIDLTIIDLTKTGQIKISDFSQSTIAYLSSELNKQTTIKEKNYPSKIEKIRYSNWEEEFINFLCQLSETKRIILFFEDIQWLDNESFIILIRLLKKTKNIYFIATCRNIYTKKVNEFTTLLNKYRSIHQMELLRFTRDETISFANAMLKEYKLTSVDYETIFRESEGNAFFLDQIFTNIKEKGSVLIDFSKIQNVLKSRFIGISNEGIKLLNIISIFYNEVDFDILMRITKKDELELLDIIEELKQRNLITELSVSNKLFIKFIHEKLREFLYSLQPDWKKRILHNKVGLILEEMYKNQPHDHIVCSNLIYHFKNSGDLLLELKYAMYYLIYLLEIKLEFYYEDTFLPSYNSLDSYLRKKELVDYFSSINNMLNKIKSSNETNEELINLEITYLYISGRYYVLKGTYAKGIKNIENMIKMSEDQCNFNYIIKGYKIMIFYGIQSHDKSIMENYINKGLRLLEKYQCEEERCLFIRYQGLNYMMNGNFKESKRSLMLSTKLLKNLCYKDRFNYTHLAMNYYYLGELKRLSLNFNEGILYFEKATNIYLENHMGDGLARFKTKAGQAAFDSGNYTLAKKYLDESLLIYDKSEMCWARPIAEGYLALIHVYNNQYTKALKYLKHAERYSKKFKNPYQEGLLNRIKAEIKVKMELDENLNKVFSDYLNLDFNDYYNKSLKLLTLVENCYEKKVLEDLKVEWINMQA